MAGMFSWSPFSSRPTSQDPESIEIRHGKQGYDLLLPPGQLASLLVSQLKELAREKAKLPDDVDIKFFYQGKRLDDKAEVGSYNIRHGSRILMTSSKKIERPLSTAATSTATSSSSTSNAPKSKSSTAASTPTGTPTPKVSTPSTPFDKIQAIRQGIKATFGPQISTFVRNPPETRKERVETKARLSELLLQQLLKFDDVIIDPDDYASKEARLERKAAVKWVQSLMDDIDGVDVDI
jgi:BAG domain/Ubiquitin family